MSSPIDPNEPVITNREDLYRALVRQFLDNAAAGHNAANDELVAQINDWQRRHQERQS